MADDGITTRMILQHLQAGFNRIDQRFEGMDTRFESIEKRLDQLEQRVERGFAEAREHREALQEDLDATIRKLAVHDKKLAMVRGESLPEDFD